MKDAVIGPIQSEAFQFPGARCVNKAKLDAVRVAGKHREIHLPIPYAGSHGCVTPKVQAASPCGAHIDRHGR